MKRKVHTKCIQSRSVGAKPWPTGKTQGLPKHLPQQAQTLPYTCYCLLPFPLVFSESCIGQPLPLPAGSASRFPG